MEKNKIFMLLLFLLPQKMLSMETNSPRSDSKQSICRRDITPPQVQTYKKTIQESSPLRTLTCTYEETIETKNNKTLQETHTVTIDITTNKPFNCYDFLCFCVCNKRS